MKPPRLCRVGLLACPRAEGAHVVGAFLLFAAPLLAQRVDILSPASHVVAARTLQLTARISNNRGAILRSRSLDWRVDDPARAAIDQAGALLGLAPGPVQVTVTDTESGASASRTIPVYPARVAVSAGSGVVQAGETVKLSADALDADGRTIPNVPFQWLSDRPDVAKISEEGALTAVAEGRVTITAALPMGSASPAFMAFAAVQVIRRPDYRLKTIVSSDLTSKNATILAPTRISAAGEFVAGLVSLSNGGQALMLSRSGRPQVLAFAGGMLNGKVITRFDSVSVNSQGDVVAIANAQNEWCEQLMVLFPAASKWAPAILDDTTYCGYWQLPVAAIDRQGAIAYRYNNTLYYRRPDGSRQTVLSTGASVTGAGTISNINTWSISPFGKVLVEVQNTTGVSSYLAWDGANLQTLFSVGVLVENNVSTSASLPAETSPGVYITRISGTRWSSIARLADGKWSFIVRDGRDGLGWIQNGFDATGGTIWYHADTEGRRAVFRTDGATISKLIDFPHWRDVSQVTATGSDAAVALGTLGGAVPQAIRFSGGTSAAVFGNGTPVDGAPAVSFAQTSIPKGISPAGIILKTYGDSLVRVTPSGVATLLKPGDPLGSGSLSSVSSIAGNRLGDIAFTANRGHTLGLYTYRGGQIQQLAEVDNQLSDSATLWWLGSGDGQIAMNNQGHVAAFTGTSGGNSIFLFTKDAATARRVVRQDGNITNFNRIAIDDNDRVAFIASLRNGRTGLFLWEQGNIRQILETGQPDPDGRTFSEFRNLQAGGTRFYLQARAGVNEHLVLDGASVKVLITDGAAASFGTPVTSCFGPEAAANSRGDLVFPVVTPAGAALFVKRADGTDAQVAIGSQRGPDREWFLSIFGAGIGEQGDIVFSALTWIDGHPRLAVYHASAN